MTNIPLKKTNRDKSLLEILNIIYKGKIKIIFSIFLFLILAFLYNQFSTPVFESKALLKKEVADRRTDELSELIRSQTMDRLETEMELMKTGEVLGKVIDRLKLRIELEKIVDPAGTSFELRDALVDFPDSSSKFTQQISFGLPKFKNIVIKNRTLEKELCIEKVGERKFELRDILENKLISSINTSSVNDLDTLKNYNSSNTLDSSLTSEKLPNRSIFDSDFYHFEFSWDDAPIGSKIYFNIVNNYQVITNLNKVINISRVGRTDVFELSVRSTSPLACELIADQTISSFREVRMEQQKQKLRYSFHFVDEQLNEVQKKLMDAESNLSSFKGSGQIMNIDQNTQELLNYQSTLEAEKLKTDLLLSDYKNKEAALSKELKSSGYFDQDLLQSSNQSQNNSPFSGLMAKLSDLEMQRLELLQKRTEKHPDVINLDEQIRGVKEKLASYNQNTLTAYTIMINALEKKLQKINGLMSGYEAKMKKLPAQETQMARLVRQKEVYEKIFKFLLDKREEMRVAELSKLQDIIIVDPPYKPYKPIKPRKLFNMAIAFAVGGFFGIVSVFLGELRKTKLIEVDYLESEFRIPVLSLIPKYSKDIIKKIKKPSGIEDSFAAIKSDNMGIRESYRLLETKLNQLNIRDKIVLITSCEENTGKTSLVANLAVTMAQNNKNILVIDCDLRKGELSKLFNVFQNSPGLIDFIENGDVPPIYTRVLKKINIIPSGGLRENSSALLSSEQMKSLFKVIDTSVYDFIIIDTPPVTRVVDTLALGEFIKNAILVVRPDISIKETVIGGIQDMDYARIKIRGIVGNAVEIQKSYRYKYRYGYGYGYSGTEKDNMDKGNTKIIRKSRSKINKIFNVGSN